MDYEFTSGKLFLSIAQSEYQNELDRTKVIDSKVATALPIIATYFFLAVQFSSVKELLYSDITAKKLIDVIIIVIIPVSYFFALVLAAISLVFMFLAIATHSYETVDPSQFNTAKQISMKEIDFAAAIATVYIRALNTNRRQNNVRAQQYMHGWLLAIISLACFIIHVLFVH